MNEPDPSTVAAARAGDVAAFESLVRAFQADVWRLALHLTGDRTVADDVVQDTFVRAFRFLRRYRGDSRFTTWLFAIARNCSRDELRRMQRRKRIAEPSHEETTGVDAFVAIEVRDALLALPTDLREAVVCVDVFGMKYRDVARVLHAPEGTIKSRVHDARARLASELGRDAEEGSDAR
jgi:RNA polymerase sigma-70 factor (ECF subfamily)